MINDTQECRDEVVEFLTLNGLYHCSLTPQEIQMAHEVYWRMREDSLYEEMINQ